MYPIHRAAYQGLGSGHLTPKVWVFNHPFLLPNSPNKTAKTKIVHSGVYLFFEAAVTNDHIFCGLKHRQFILLQFERSEVRHRSSGSDYIDGRAAPILVAPGEIFFPNLLQFLETACILRLVAPSSIFKMHYLRQFLFLLSHLPSLYASCLPLTRIKGIALGPLDKPLSPETPSTLHPLSATSMEISNHLTIYYKLSHTHELILHVFKHSLVSQR